MRFPRLTRHWAVPGLALVTMLGVGTLPHVIGSAGADTPDLPTLTPAELLAKARTAQVTALSGTVALTSHLGLPSLDTLGLGGSSPTSLTSLLSGKHSADVWIDGPDHLRIATAAPMAETNWIRNGTDLWSYDSTTLRATHATLPADAGPGSAHMAGGAVPDPAHETPVQFAQDLLDHVTPTTSVTVDAPRYVADRPVYQLVLAPKSDASTVKSVTVSVDAATGLPLDIRIDGASGTTPALEFGFTSISFDKPSASTFAFTPPPGSTVVQASNPAGLVVPQGPGPDGVRRRYARRVPPGAVAGVVPPQLAPSVGTGQTGGVTTIGSDWETVVVIPRGQLPVRYGQLLNSAPSVTVGSHSGRLVTTTLVNIVVLDDGRIAVGAVTPSALESALATIG